MPISNDYLDDKSVVSLEFLAPIKTLFESNETVLKTAAIFAKYSIENDPKKYQYRHSFEMNNLPETELEIFNVFKEYVNSPVDEDDEEEVGLSPEKLLELRDPEGLRNLPLESEKVQKMIADLREDHKPFTLIQEIYQDVMSAIQENSKGQPITLEHLDIQVVYFNKADPSKELIYSAFAPGASVAVK